MPAPNSASFDSTIGEESSAVVPGLIVLSSLKQGWKGLELVQYREHLKESAVAPLSRHLILINIGHAHKLRLKIGESVHQGYLHPNNVTIVPAGVSSEWFLPEQKEANVLTLFLQTTFVRELAAASDLNPDHIEIIEAFGQPDPQLKHIGLALLAELESGCMAGRLYGESLATAVAVHLLQRYSTKKPQSCNYPSGLLSYKQRQVIDYIHTHLDRDINLTELAVLVGLSPYYFARLFKQSMGIAPYQYVLQCRVERAKQLLQNRELAIAQVAMQSGFTDQNHLTRVFRRLTGTTPKAYRER